MYGIKEMLISKEDFYTKTLILWIRYIEAFCQLTSPLLQNLDMNHRTFLDGEKDYFL